MKCVLDVLKHAGVYMDDSQIVRLLVRRGRIVPGGSVEVRIEPLPESQPSLWE
jgi:crossover junction endodeoxyribonuclease RusA